MKTNEEKLKRLLEVAVENGWDIPIDIYTPSESFKYDTLKIIEIKWNYFVQYFSVYIETRHPDDAGRIFRNYVININDLVTNWEKGEISFIEALCKDEKSNWGLSNFELSLKEVILYAQETYYYDLSESIRQQWTLQRTSQRLNWLFETFKHLL